MINNDLLFQSVQGLHFIGAGPSITLLKATGTAFTTAVINLDGSAQSIFEGFTITGDGSEQVTNAVIQQWSSNAYRSTTGNRWRDIIIDTINCVNGINLAGSNQNDTTLFLNCEISGKNYKPWSNIGNWQNGFLVGDGTYGNNFDHYAINCSTSFWYYGVNCNASTLQWLNGNGGSCYLDFNYKPSGPIEINGYESEGSAQFATFVGSFNICRLVNCKYDSSQINSSANWVYFNNPMGAAVIGCAVWNALSGIIPKILLNWRGAPSVPSICRVEDSVIILNGGTTITSPNNLFSGTSSVANGAVLEIKNSLVPITGNCITIGYWRNTMGELLYSQPAIPGTGVSFENPYPIPANVYINGGTVTSIEVNGVNTGLTSGCLLVPSFGNILINYSVAPSWTWVGA